MKETKLCNTIESDSLEVISKIQRVPEFMQFVQWFATPSQLRKEKTQKKFADAIGVSQDTLTNWKQHPKFSLLVQQNMSEWMKERIPDVIGGLYSRACKKGSAKDVEAFLRLTGMLNDKK